MRPLITRILVAWLFLPGIACAQQIVYASPPSGGVLASNTDFQIVGRCGSNIWVYLNRGHDDPVIDLYDADMHLKQRVRMDFLPRGVSGVDFIAYPEKVLMFYQYFRKGEVLCYVATLNGEARPEGKPLLIDRSVLRFSNAAADSYNMVYSENKEKIMVFMIRKRAGTAENHIFSFLMDQDLHLLQKKENVLMVSNPDDVLSNFQLANDGNLVFAVIGKDATDNSFIVRVGLVITGLLQDTLQINAMPLNGHYLDTLLQVKLDNQGDRVYLASFYFDNRKRNINGLFFCRTDSSLPALPRFLPFDQFIRAKIKGGESTVRQAFDDYKLRHMVIQGKGGVLLAAENAYEDPVRGDSYQDIALLSYDGLDSLKWCRVIRKDQSDDLGYDFSSFQLINTGDRLHFIFNGKNKGSYTFSNYIYLITDYSLSREGDLELLPLMRDLERKYHLMPRYARQISAREVVLPFELGSELSFARIDY